MNTFDIETEINGCVQWIKEHREERLDSVTT